MSADAVALDRRQRRRLETIEEVLDVALDVMAEQGVAGLSVGEVARRMGIRPPSLYVYFPSKHALYDALFARGARALLEVMRSSSSFNLADNVTLEQTLLEAGRDLVSWAVQHPAYSQLLFWRPVPGFAPSPESYAPAIALVEEARARFAELQRRGLVRSDVTAEQVQRDWTIVGAGVISQQLSNAPQETFDEGAFTTALPRLVAMFTAYYGAEPASASAKSAPKRGARRANQC